MKPDKFPGARWQFGYVIPLMTITGLIVG